jgi:hypothetical protein
MVFQVQENGRTADIEHNLNALARPLWMLCADHFSTEDREDEVMLCVSSFNLHYEYGWNIAGTLHLRA